MKAQLYEDGLCRVFGRDQHILCDVYGTDGKDMAGVDAALKRVRMRRVGKWKVWSAANFREATVRFESRKQGRQ